MNFLITGGNGFIARELTGFLKEDGHQILSLPRQNLDVCDFKQVNNFFLNHPIDIVIHTAIKGGRRLREDLPSDVFDNLIMFNNLAVNSHQFKLMINVGSGAAFDRTKSNLFTREARIWERNPRDYYGLSKNLIAKRIVNLNSNIVNLRLFGCFGKKEKETRLFKSAITNFNAGKAAILHQDKLMDYFYVGDLYHVICHYVQNYDSLAFKDINLCYSQKKTLREMVFLIKNLTGTHSDVIIEKKEMGLPYAGSSERLNSFNLPLVGLERGIKEMLEDYET